MYNYKSNLVLHASTEKLQYVPLKYDKLRESDLFNKCWDCGGLYCVNNKYKIQSKVQVWN